MIGSLPQNLGLAVTRDRGAKQAQKIRRQTKITGDRSIQAPHPHGVVFRNG